jgi:allophanate hydrolase subunit 1
MEMAVYVDDMRAAFRGMIMCHLLADSDEELHAMAARIGLKMSWHQKPGTVHSHYDIALSKRRMAVHFGAIEITRSQLGAILKKKREARTKEKEDERVCEVPVVLEVPTAE